MKRQLATSVARKGNARLMLGLIGASLSVVCSVEAQSIRWLGTFPNRPYTIPLDVSADGRVVVGWCDMMPNWSRPLAFRWQNGQMQSLSGLSDVDSAAHAVSANGAVVVGQAVNNGRYQAFRWEDGVVQWLTTQGGEAWDVSANGQVVVGIEYLGDQVQRAFHWENGVMEYLTTPDGFSSYAAKVSADGRVVAGWIRSNNTPATACRWVNGTLQLLSVPESQWSEATAVSADGGVVAGIATSPDARPFRWANGVFRSLSVPAGASTRVYGMSRDGRVIVGMLTLPQSSAVRWTNGVMDDLNQTYAAILGSGARLLGVRDVSPDGRYLVGVGMRWSNGMRQEGFLLDSGVSCIAHNGDVNGDGCVDDADLLAVLFRFGATGQSLEGADVNCDSVVDDADLLTVLFNFGDGC